MVNNDEKLRIIQFLNDPIKYGLWESKFEWTEAKGVFTKLFTAKRVSIPKIGPYDVLLILEYLSNKKKGNKFSGEMLRDEIKTVVSRCNILDYDKYILLYENVVESLVIDTNRIIINGDLTFVFEIPTYYNSGVLKLLSIDKEINKKVDKIFKALSYRGNETTRKLYYPQDVLINPFFVYVDVVSRDIFPEYTQDIFFKDSYKSFLAQEYENSMSKIGKLCEYTLSEIYQTLFREFVPEGSTIGKLHSSIHKKVMEKLKLPNKKSERANFDELYSYAKNLEEKDSIPDQELIKTIRLLSSLLKKEQNYNKKIIENNGDKYPSISIFPKHIAGYLKKILHYRNSVSHNSGTYFSYIDNLNMLFYYITFHSWWRDTYHHIDSEQDEIDILKSIISIAEN